MRSKIIILLTSLFVFITSLSAIAGIDINKLQHIEIKKLKTVSEQILTGGQPTKAQLNQLKQLGIKNIVNLRPQTEQTWNEKQYVESLGLNYYSLSVAGAKGVNSDNADKLASLLDQLSGEPVFLHCASGNRVGALAALNEFKSNGGDLESAIATGKKWGLTRLEKVVREQLNPK
ncbi:hypothetical protein D5R81_14360 [Parashewanella spongiae]|uniref:DSP-PTPase phosphatase fused to NAD+ Kinase domain-containing protein n=1 Tax=Parashewanella spongiae TaxID=342950 RepID=A0A3A6U3S0_9GAMM|nr:protein tyrosine phosphatase family protein [Parashewanella spongiae]MCL1079198.1 protein tyrosine phosphatase family protein [Parashewanella spongiae]RJY10613.1 hypothetical protein D5R81_14360 [Parashewanella spongiae]